MSRINRWRRTLATRNGRHVITAWLRWHLADEQFAARRTS